MTIKSEKAKEYINKMSLNAANVEAIIQHNMPINGTLLLNINRSVELAEQEAEQRAIEAFKRTCKLFTGCEDNIDCLFCSQLQNFTELLNQ